MCTVLKSLFFFHNDALPPPLPSPKKKETKEKLFCTKGVSESCEKWNMKNVFQNTVASAITRPITNYKEKEKKEDNQKKQTILFMNVS